ncbi:hypothetical protein [Shimia sagamensis]|uniref:Uncharacterized protein n=1 Tax=Shimia sagamensis TaxID=1566352 RepID=A0ABY1PJ13_9RHOB|nr:hypothetical protein [Shimia sagamensis]SMP34304.1 hypothetical protein SAMN06265373_1107 [Shimia sagamensis]
MIGEPDVVGETENNSRATQRKYFVQDSLQTSTCETRAEAWLTGMQAETASLAALTNGLSIILETHTAAAHALEKMVGAIVRKLEAFE